jgi:hypothetical protein
MYSIMVMIHHASQILTHTLYSTCMHVLCICSKHGNERNSWKHTYFGSNRLDTRGTEPKPRTEPEQRHATQSGSRFLGHPFFGSRFSRFRFGSGTTLTPTYQFGELIPQILHQARLWWISLATSIPYPQNIIKLYIFQHVLWWNDIWEQYALIFNVEPCFRRWQLHSWSHNTSGSYQIRIQSTSVVISSKWLKHSMLTWQWCVFCNLAKCFISQGILRDFAIHQAVYLTVVV